MPGIMLGLEVKWRPYVWQIGIDKGLSITAYDTDPYIVFGARYELY